jgi:transposase-like protein
MIKTYSDEKRKEVIDARKAGATIAQIAAQTGVGRTTVKAWLKDAGLTVNRKWKSDEIQTILKEYEECRSPKTIREKYGISKSELYRLRKKMQADQRIVVKIILSGKLLQ